MNSININFVKYLPITLNITFRTKIQRSRTEVLADGGSALTRLGKYGITVTPLY